MGMRAKRLAVELKRLSTSPPPGVAAWPRDESRVDELDAEIVGAPETPYASGVFRLRVTVPEEYPIRPPLVRFVTKIYHPNIDSQGRICLDTLNMPPKGAWKPSLNVSTVLASVQLLMSHPNPDDGLMADITDQYKRFPEKFAATAADWTARYAKEPAVHASDPSPSPLPPASISEPRAPPAPRELAPSKGDPPVSVISGNQAPCPSPQLQNGSDVHTSHEPSVAPASAANRKRLRNSANRMHEDEVQLMGEGQPGDLSPAREAVASTRTAIPGAREAPRRSVRNGASSSIAENDMADVIQVEESDDEEPTVVSKLVPETTIKSTAEAPQTTRGLEEVVPRKSSSKAGSRLKKRRR